MKEDSIPDRLLVVSPKNLMKILLSAYSCEPNKGSEPGVGWNWAVELARQGHEVTVLTRSNNRVKIEPALKELAVPGLSFFYYDLPVLSKIWKRGVAGVQFYYQMWQIGAYFAARTLIREKPFDLVHHLTFGVFRQASWMGRLGIPFVLGPIGGGEVTPRRFIGTYPFSGRVIEWVRRLGNSLSLLDPALWQMCRAAAIIFCRTPQTMRALPARYWNKCEIQLEIGVSPTWLIEKPSVPQSPEFLYAGRLLDWKGIHLALDALAEALKYRSDLKLTIVGKGPAEKWLKERAARLGVSKSVEWCSWMPQTELRKSYFESLALILPTLHDSSQSAILESFASGTPVICLDIGGPAEIVPDHSGFKIECTTRPVEAVVEDLAQAMLTLANDRDIAARMSQNALDYARTQDWSAAVTRIYARIQRLSTISHRAATGVLPSQSAVNVEFE